MGTPRYRQVLAALSLLVATPAHAIDACDPIALRQGGALTACLQELQDQIATLRLNLRSAPTGRDELDRLRLDNERLKVVVCSLAPMKVDESLRRLLGEIGCRR